MKPSAWLLSSVFLVSLAGAQEKSIPQLYRRDIVDARTIAVIAYPSSAVQDSQENQRARLEVQTAMLNWGKYQIESEESADLIMVVRRGHTETATVGGTAIPPVLVDPTGSGVNIGIHRGQSPPLSRTGSAGAGSQPRTGSEVSSGEDLLEVYLGRKPLSGDASRDPTEYPLDEPPAWFYAATDALKSPKIEAVAQFKKAVEAAEKKKP
jgi:hypothetical protein